MKTLAHQRNGQGEALIVVHGLFGSASNWRNVALQLADDFAIWALDLRNHGSSFHKNGMSYPEQARDILAWMDEQGIEKASFLGHSMGGKVVMEFALNYPARVNKLLIADIAPIAYEPSHDAIIESLKKLRKKQPWRERRDADKYLTKKLGSETIQTRLFLLTNLRRTSDGLKLRIPIKKIARGYEDIIAAPPAIEAGKVFNGPCLVIRGTQSDYVPDSSLEVFNKHFPANQVCNIEGGHWLHAEQTNEFAQAVKDFLTQ